MKKIIFSVFALVILLAMLLGVKALKETYSSVPVITVKFSEQSKITNAVLSGPSGRIYTFSYSPDKGELALLHTLTLTQALTNGNYTLFVEAFDRVENYVNTTQIIELSVPYIFTNITNPPLGVSPVRVFNLTIETPGNPAECGYSNFAGASYDTLTNYFESITSTMHTKYFFNNDSSFLSSPQAERALYVFCKQTDNGRINPATFMISYDLTPPHIGAVADPRVVVDRQEDGRIIANIKVNSDSDKVVCRYSDAVPKNASAIEFIADKGRFQDMTNYFGASADESNSSAYGLAPTATVNLTPYLPLSGITRQYEFTINVSCINRATFDLSDYTNRTSNTVSVPITVNLLSPITLTKISPSDYTSNTSVFLNFTTNKFSLCTYELNGSSGALTSSDRKVHTKNFGTLPTGSYTISVNCEAEAASITKDFPLVIDTTPPTVPLISAPNATCTKSFSATFKSNDSESGISGYNYTFELGGGKSVKGIALGANPTATITKDAEGGNLNLTQNQGYVFRARAINNAGLTGAEGISNQIIYDQTGVSCDKTPPSIFLRKNATSSGTYITLVCLDSQTKCDNSSYTYFISSSSQCTGIPLSLDYSLQWQSFTTQITSSGYFCYEAKDIAGNTAKGNENVTILSADHCSNLVKDIEETDTDCGGAGTCLRCGIGKSCSANSDCASIFCDKTSNACQEPACDDLIENGYETDIDCGGIDCRKCELNKKCSSNVDCISSYCTMNKTCATPYCNDSIWNGNETDIDCGGSCSKCAIGKSCFADSDCVSGKCFSFECIQPPLEGNVSIAPIGEEALDMLKVIKIIILLLGFLFVGTGAGYLIYKKYGVKKTAAPKQETKPSAASAPQKTVIKQRPLTAAERLKLAAQREKERIEKGLEREKVFGVFGGKPLSQKAAAKPQEKISLGKIADLIKLKPSQPSPKKEAFDKLGEIAGRREDIFEKLEELKKKQAIERAGKLKSNNKNKK